MKYSTKDIENILYKYLPIEEGYQRAVIEAMNYSFRAGGKRLRPMIMKLVYDMFAIEEKLDLIGPFMAALEMIHTYSLIHDDLPALDNDLVRRGLPTCHAKYGEDMAILAGDGLLNFAFETASKAFLACPGNVAVEKAFVSLAKRPGIYGMIGGQVLDVAMSGKPLDDEQIDFININKTAALIVCAMEIGGLLGGADETDCENLGHIAKCVGLAFQVQDDILDIIGDEEKLGKPVKSDEKNAKYNYATVHGLEEAKCYVMEMSRKAIMMIKDIKASNEDARQQLMELVNSLINREF
ncbi:MAG: polyprenyl synthetase family protein [Lachnospiraceae bacterium]|nr:polyprenyl synthetase family protein [Lachnospiraceae bacterium]